MFTLQNGIWTGLPGQLIFTPHPSIMKCSLTDTTQNAPCLPELNFNIEIRNPRGAHPGSTLEVQAKGAGLSFHPSTFGPVLKTVTATTISVIEARLNEVTRIRGDDPEMRGLNRLDLYMKFSEPLSALLQQSVASQGIHQPSSRLKYMKFSLD